MICACGIDLGTKAALAVVAGGARPALLRAIAMPDPRDRDLRYGRLWALLEETTAEFAPVVVATEPVFAAPADQRRQAGLHQAVQQGIVRAVCMAHGIAFRAHAAATVRVTVCGHGRATKEQAARAIAQRYGIAVPSSEHVGDAIALAHCALVRWETEQAVAGQGVLEVGRARRQGRREPAAIVTGGSHRP